MKNVRYSSCIKNSEIHGDQVFNHSSFPGISAICNFQGLFCFRRFNNKIQKLKQALRCNRGQKRKQTPCLSLHAPPPPYPSHPPTKFPSQFFYLSQRDIRSNKYGNSVNILQTKGRKMKKTNRQSWCMVVLCYSIREESVKNRFIASNCGKSMKLHTQK